ncbi:hypothetical protein WJX73_005071 [Symbiochloris irregularis]|uniref:Peptidase M24 domain-containing protein n=1 Tax=Symbiochloris irregularis TaxID=706552 RepID=A0AAW1NXA5_9CHLO
MRVCQQRPLLQSKPDFGVTLRTRRGVQQALRCRSAVTDIALVDKLLTARSQAEELFSAVESKGLLTPGRSEKEVDKQVFQLAAADYGTRQHWHKRTPRFGENTVHPIFVDTPDAQLKEDDICFLDLGPVFKRIEADFGRTYVLGQDPEKHKLNQALTRIFNICKQQYLSAPDIIGADFFTFVKETCAQHGYQYANDQFCAHLLGEFSHEVKFGETSTNYACPDNCTPMNAPHTNGQPRHWILEIHLLQDPKIGRYGGFYEDLLDISI